MNGDLGHDSALQGYTGQGTTLPNDMNFAVNQAPGAGPIARLVVQQYNALPLHRGCHHEYRERRERLFEAKQNCHEMLGKNGTGNKFRMATNNQ